MPTSSIGLIVTSLLEGLSLWKVRNASYWSRMNGPYVVQGAVVYPIDPSIVNEMVPMEADVLQLASMNIDYWMPIGSVDVAPSRLTRNILLLRIQICLSLSWILLECNLFLSLCILIVILN